MRGVLKALMVAAMLALASASPTMAQQAGTAAPTNVMPIYSNTLAPGWNNWSWATVTISAQISDPEETPISVTAEGWQALYLQHAPFSTQGYSTLAFWVHGGARGGQVLQVQAVNAQGEALPNRYVRVTAAANEWTEVNIALSDIGAENTTVGGFWIQNGSADTIPRFYVNEISLH